MCKLQLALPHPHPSQSSQSSHNSRNSQNSQKSPFSQPSSRLPSAAKVPQNVKFALKFKFFSRNIWSVRKNCLPLHSLFGGHPTEKHPGQRRGGIPPKFFFQKNLVDSKTRRNFANAFGFKKARALKRTLKRLTIDKSSTRAR